MITWSTVLMKPVRQPHHGSTAPDVTPLVVIRLMTFNVAGKLSVTRMGGDLRERHI